MELNLSDILEVQFRLLYFLHMSINDFNEMDLRDISWTYSRLLKQLEDEKLPEKR
jgi:hypothetical protein